LELERVIAPALAVNEIAPPVPELPKYEYEYDRAPPSVRTILLAVEVKAILPPLPLFPVAASENAPNAAGEFRYSGSMKEPVLAIAPVAVNSIAPPTPPILLEASMLLKVIPPFTAVNLTSPPAVFGTTRTEPSNVIPSGRGELVKAGGLV
jgi:hypothetical protein